MSNPNTPSQQHIPSSGGLISSSYRFTVNSELEDPREERSPIKQPTHSMVRPVYQFMPHIEGQVSPVLANIPFAVRSRDALQHGVSARVGSPTWDIERESASVHSSQANSIHSSPPQPISTPRPTVPPAFSPSSTPPSVPRSYPRPVPRPVPSNTGSEGQDDFSFFTRQTPVAKPPTNVPLRGAAPPFPAGRQPIVLVPETQVSQTQPESLQSTQREYIFVNSLQPSVGYCPSQPVDLTGATPPPPTPEPISKSKRGGSARGGLAQGGSTRGLPRTRGSGRGRGGAKSSKARGKQRDPNPLSAGEGEDEYGTSAPASKRRRTTAATEKEPKDAAIAAEAAIGFEEESDKDNSELELDEVSSKFSSPENALAFVSAFYSVDSYNYYKSNQMHAFRTISKNTFKGRLSPTQLMNGNKNLLSKYKIHEELMEQTGMGTASEEVVQQYLNAQNYTIKAKTILQFGQSPVYQVMHEVLQTNPSVLKSLSLDPSRELSPIDNTFNTGYIGGNEDNSDDLEVLSPALEYTPTKSLPTPKSACTPKSAAAPKGMATTKLRNRAESIIDLDPTTDSTVNRQSPAKPKKSNASPKKEPADRDDPYMAAIQRSMAYMQDVVEQSRKQQNELFKSQQAMQQAQMAASKAEAVARNASIR